MLARRGAVVHGPWETLKAGDIVEAQVTGVNKGGLELKVTTPGRLCRRGRWIPSLTLI